MMNDDDDVNTTSLLTLRVVTNEVCAIIIHKNILDGWRSRRFVQKYSITSALHMPLCCCNVMFLYSFCVRSNVGALYGK